MATRKNVSGLANSADLPPSEQMQPRKEVHYAVDRDDDTSTATTRKNIVMHGLMGEWPPPPGTHCYHDGHAFEREPVPLPEHFNFTKQVYHVKYCFCSGECVLAFVLEHRSSNFTKEIVLVFQMLAEVYGITEPVSPAPSRFRLREFDPVNGLTIDEFRTHHTHTVERPLVYPFVSAYILYEGTQARNHRVHDEQRRLVVPNAPTTKPSAAHKLRGLRRPQKTSTAASSLAPGSADSASAGAEKSLYDQFLENDGAMDVAASTKEATGANNNSATSSSASGSSDGAHTQAPRSGAAAATPRSRKPVASKKKGAQTGNLSQWLS